MKTFAQYWAKMPPLAPMNNEEQAQVWFLAGMNEADERHAVLSNSTDGLGPKHAGMRISASGLLGRIRDKWKVENHQRYVAGELLRHLEELAERFYGGDVKAVDEFLQLYDLDDTRP